MTVRIRWTVWSSRELQKELLAVLSSGRDITVIGDRYVARNKMLMNRDEQTVLNREQMNSRETPISRLIPWECDDDEAQWKPHWSKRRDVAVVDCHRNCSFIILYLCGELVCQSLSCGSFKWKSGDWQYQPEQDGDVFMFGWSQVLMR